MKPHTPPTRKALNTYAARNRGALLETLPAGACALVHSGQEALRNRDVEYPFRVNSDFFYLTGFDEPDAILLLMHDQSVLFLREKDPLKETWEGRRLGTEMAPSTLQIDAALDIEGFEQVLSDLTDDCSEIFFSFSEFEFWQATMQQLISSAKAKSRQGVESPAKFVDLDRPLHELRLLKTDQEVEWMRNAAQISVAGHLQAMRSVGGLTQERQLQGRLEDGFWQSGAHRVSFNSICAGGENACILHYTENSDLLRPGELVLVDAGAEYNYYAGDITTTFPVNGKFSPAQASIYELVLKAQSAVIKLIRPGVAFSQLQATTLKVLTQGLIDLQILNGDLDTLIEKKAYQDFFMHGTGHWLGLDVHDVGAYKCNKQWRCLQAGMVVTVEPGLYLSNQHKPLAAHWHSIGVRIEDDVLVTPMGCEVLTQGLPRTVQEIETFMATNFDETNF